MAASSSRLHPVYTRDGRDGFPSEDHFDGLVEDYLMSLNAKKRDKALMTRDMYDSVLATLLDPRNTNIETAQFRFWAKRMFRLVSTGNAYIVTQENRPVAVKDQIYDVLVQCHGQAAHGGRDKTSAQVRRYYSYIPKELIARFVKACPLCNARRTSNKAYFVQTEDASYPAPEAEGQAASGLPGPAIHPSDPSPFNFGIGEDASYDDYGTEVDVSDRPETAQSSLTQDSPLSSPGIDGAFTHSAPPSLASGMQHNQNFYFPLQPFQNEAPSEYLPWPVDPTGNFPISASSEPPYPTFAGDHGDWSTGLPNIKVEEEVCNDPGAPGTARRLQRPPPLDLRGSSNLLTTDFATLLRQELGDNSWGTGGSTSHYPAYSMPLSAPAYTQSFMFNHGIPSPAPSSAGSSQGMQHSLSASSAVFPYGVTSTGTPHLGYGIPPTPRSSVPPLTASSVCGFPPSTSRSSKDLAHAMAQSIQDMLDSTPPNPNVTEVPPPSHHSSPRRPVMPPAEAGPYANIFELQPELGLLKSSP